MIKYQTHNVLLKLLLFLFVIHNATSLHCSPYCTYTFVPGSNNYVPGCTGLGSNQCTECDPRFYYPIPSAGTCVFNETNIYNSSIGFTINSWNSNGGVNTNPDDGDNWLRINNQYTVLNVVNEVQPIGNSAFRPVAYYGVRCRIHFSLKGPNFQPNITFRIGVHTEQVQLVPVTNSQYTIDQWIFTSQFIPYDREHFQVFIERNDSSGNPAGKEILIKDGVCFIAHCVQFCISCTSLHDCKGCQPGYFLDVNRYCVSVCPIGQFLNTTNNFCQLCDPKCDICTTGPTICTNCVDYGPFQSFLQGTTCSYSCTAPKIKEHETHTCVCPIFGYTTVASVCTACIPNCMNCTATNINLCQMCDPFYFIVVGNTSCVLVCPPGQYGLTTGYIGICFPCDLTKCTQCINTSTTCTRCNFPPPNVLYLANYQCLPICPDGYEGNNSTFQCDLCLLGTYSYQNVCYTQCPQFYLQRHDIRACVLPGGYPLNLTVQVDGPSTLKFTIKFPLGLLPANFTSLLASWGNIIELQYVTETQHQLLYYSRRMLQTFFRMNISSVIISNTSIVMYSSSATPEDLIYTHSFKATFIDNLFSPKNVIYSISAKNSTDMFPWVVRQYFDLNMKPLYLIGIFLAAIGLIIILMRTKYVYRILIEYIHCIQLLGLTFYAIYPHSIQLNLYTFVMGLDFSNFSFIINLTAKFIPACYDCKSIVGFTFAIGDMNWIRLTGSLLLCLAIMLVFCLLIYAFKCSRMYAPFYLKLVLDLIIVKSLHSWFSSLFYSGLNFKYNTNDKDLYILSMHMLSYFLIGPVLYLRFKSMSQNKFPNLSFFFLVVFIVLLSLLGLAPTLICALLMMIAAVQWTLTFGLKITQQQKPFIRMNKIDDFDSNGNNSSINNQNKIQYQPRYEEQYQEYLILRYHNHLLRCMRPITAFLVACIIMIHDQIIPIILVSVVLFLLLILIIIDIYFLYEYYQDLQKRQVLKAAPKEKSIMNQTKQDLKLHEKQTEYKQNINQIDKQLKIFDEDDIDDDIVANKFRKNRQNVINPFVNGNNVGGNGSSLMKNFE